MKGDIAMTNQMKLKMKKALCGVFSAAALGGSAIALTAPQANAMAFAETFELSAQATQCRAANNQAADCMQDDPFEKTVQPGLVLASEISGGGILLLGAAGVVVAVADKKRKHKL